MAYDVRQQVEKALKAVGLTGLAPTLVAIVEDIGEQIAQAKVESLVREHEETLSRLRAVLDGARSNPTRSAGQDAAAAGRPVGAPTDTRKRRPSGLRERVLSAVREQPGIQRRDLLHQLRPEGKKASETREFDNQMLRAVRRLVEAGDLAITDDARLSAKSGGADAE